MTDRDFDELVRLVLEVCGETALGIAVARALRQVPHHPVAASRRGLVPLNSRHRAVEIDGSTLRAVLAGELQRLLRPH